GRDGVFIDDCQLHRLDISLQLSHRPHFDIEIKAISLDEFVLKEGLKLYEMPDHLFYPQATAVWFDGQQEHLDTFNTFAGLLTLGAMTRNKRVSRHNLREGGSTKLQAFQGA